MALHAPLTQTQPVAETAALVEDYAIARHADIGRLAESAVDPLIESADMLGELGLGGLEGATGGMAAQMLEQFRPMIAPLMEQMFWQMLLDPESFRQGLFGAALGEREIPFEEIAEAYQGVAYELDADRDQRIVGIDLAREESADTVTIELILERGEDGWRVVEFADLADAIAETVGSGR